MNLQIKNAALCLWITTATLGGCSKPLIENGEDLVNTAKGEAQSSAANIIVYQTNMGATKKMNREANIDFNTNVASAASITIDPAIKYQTVQGLGMALTGSSAYMLKQLSEEARTEVLTKVFSQNSGMNMGVVRLTIGASDYSKTSYTYDDQTGTNTDADLSDFSIKEDDINYVIPVLHEILAINPNIYIIASPWSAPAWMKRNNSLSGADSTVNTLKTGYYSVFASYLVKYVQAMKTNHNITIHAITPQNEPRTVKSEYITMYMHPNWQKDMIREYLRPRLDAAGFSSVKIFCGDNNWSGSTYQTAVLSDPGAYAAVAGSAFHGYAGDASVMSSIRNAYPDKEIHYTEFSDRTDNSWASQLGWMGKDHLIQPLRNWAKSVIYWNLALDENSEPNIKAGTNYSRPFVTINSSTKAISYNVDYYVISHVSKFLRAGAQRISSSDISASHNVYNVAFQNPDGWKTLVAINRGSSARTVDFKIGAQKFTYTLQPDALVTFNWN